MKKNAFLYLLFFACFFSILSCSSNDDEMVIIPDDETIEPIDTTDNTGGDLPRTYSTEAYSVGDWGIEIYVPSDYDSLSKYPVIYFNDGDLFADVFGFLTTLDAPAFIMVGISGDNGRAERFLPYDDPVVSADLGAYIPSASFYSDAIVDEIMPFVESKFRIIGNKKALFGISLGGLHATWMAIKYPKVFNFIGAISPSYWVSNEAVFGEDLSDLDPPGLFPPTKIYFDRGSAEWRNHLSFITQLKSAGLVYGESLFYYEVEGATHSSQDWQLRIDIPFRIFLEGLGASDEPTELEFHSYCANDLTNNNENTTRLNPIIHYENGIKFSVISEAEYSIIQGNGTIGFDGIYNISSGTSMVVQATYKGFTDFGTITSCN